MKRLSLIFLLLLILSNGPRAARDRLGNQRPSVGLSISIGQGVPVEVAPLLRRALFRYLSYQMGQTGFSVGECAPGHNPLADIALEFSVEADTEQLPAATELARWIVDPPVSDWVLRAITDSQTDADTITIRSTEPQAADSACLLPEGALFLMRASDMIASQFVHTTPRDLGWVAEEAVPVQVYVDSTFRSRYPRSWDGRVQQVIHTTSLSMADQLGMGLDRQHTMLVDVGGKPGINLLNLHLAMHTQKPMSPQMLVIGLYGGHVDPKVGGIQRDGLDKIGYASLAKRRITMTDIYLPEDLEHWWPWVMSHILAHEVYHALGGAVHVWDAEAIMNPLFVWAMSDSLDPVNSRLVRSIVVDNKPAGSKAQYAQRVMDAVDGSLSGSLIDWPQFAYDFTDVLASSMKTPHIDSSLRADLMAASVGVELLKSGPSGRAEQIYSRLTQKYPDEASFWYWLWRSQPAHLADTALAKAAQMGYYPAQMDLVKGLKR